MSLDFCQFTTKTATYLTRRMSKELYLYRDQMNRELRLAMRPTRIVSLVPSISELLFDIGVEDRVVGVTKFCVHPSHWLATKTIVGGTKTLKTEVISMLAPDLIIGAKEENERDQIEMLTEIAPVFMADVKCIQDATALVEVIGEICGVAETSRRLCNDIQLHLSGLQHKATGKVAYLIWNQPMMCVGSDTYIDSVLTWMGYENVASALSGSRYPEITMNVLKSLNPDKIFLSSEPYPFRDKHISQFQMDFPNCDVRLVDGEMFSWYGSRMLRIQIPNEHGSL